MNTLTQVLYTAITRVTGGRDGRALSNDGLLDVQMAAPEGLGGKGGATNPEQLFAAGYSACFMGALKYVAADQKIQIPEDAAIDAEVDLGPIDSGNGFGLAVRLSITLPGVDRAISEKLVDQAHQVCPYSTATRNNIHVSLVVA
jgi:osmotically inducible protein OsmC